MNIFTDINIAAVEAEFSAFDSMSKGIIDLIPAAVNAVKAAVTRKLELFGSVGKAAPDARNLDQIVQLVVKEVMKELKEK